MVDWQEAIYWALSTWQKESDFIVWSDIPLDYLQIIKKSQPWDRKYFTLNQNKEGFRYWCTRLSAMVVIFSYWNREIKEADMYWCLEVAESMWFVQNQGRYTRLWVSAAVKYYNDRYPWQKMLYARTSIWSTEDKLSMHLWHGGVCTRRMSADHLRDIAEDLIADQTSYNDMYFWHAHSRWKPKIDNMDMFVVNTYKWSEINEYHVQNVDALIDSWFYYPAMYIVLPDPDNIQENVRKAKMLRSLMRINQNLKTISIAESTKQKLDMCWDIYEDLYKKVS